MHPIMWRIAVCHANKEGEVQCPFQLNWRLISTPISYMSDVFSGRILSILSLVSVPADLVQNYFGVQDTCHIAVPTRWFSSKNQEHHLLWQHQQVVSLARKVIVPNSPIATAFHFQLARANLTGSGHFRHCAVSASHRWLRGTSCEQQACRELLLVECLTMYSFSVYRHSERPIIFEPCRLTCMYGYY